MKTDKTNILFMFCALIIGLVNVYDVYLSLIYYWHLFEFEQNPFSSFIISTFGICDFITLKSLGTILAAILSICLIKTRYRTALLPVCLFQVSLFCHLNFSAKSEAVGNVHDPAPIIHVMEFLSDPQDFKDRYWKLEADFR